MVDGQKRTIVVRVVDGQIEGAAADAGAVVRRIAGDRMRSGIPIGTREADELELTVNGEAVPLSAGKGRLSRRSFRVAFEYRGADYVFGPVTDDESALSRGGVELARYFINADDQVEFFDDGAQTPTATESAVGVTVAAAFGCGAMHGFGAFVEALVNGAGQT